jgi:hypothetical protein
MEQRTLKLAARNIVVCFLTTEAQRFFTEFTEFHLSNAQRRFALQSSQSIVLESYLGELCKAKRLCVVKYIFSQRPL